MGKMKKSVKKFLSMLLALALVVTGIRWFDSDAEVKAATSGYTELTFKDWGIKNGEYEGQTAYNLLDTTITSLDKVAFTGKLTFNESNSFRIGGKNGWAGLTFMINQDGKLYLSDESDDDGDDNATVEDVTLSKTEAFTLRLTFDKDAEENLWTVGIYVNGTHVADFKDTMNLGTGLLVWGEDMVLEDVIYGEDATYTELTFSDWGITDGTCGDGTAYALTDKVITSLDGVAFTGKITYNTARDFRIGGLDNVTDGAWLGLYFSITDSGGLHVSDQTGGSTAWKILEGTNLSKREQFELRLTFDQDDATQKWTVRIYVNGVHQTNFTAAMNLGTAFLVNGDGMTVEDVDKKPSYKELTFKDWGIQGGAYKSGTGYTLTDESITSLDKVAFTGKFTYNNTSSYLRIGGSDEKKDGAWLGLHFAIDNGHLYICDETGGGAGNRTLTDTNISANTAFELRLTFDKGTGENEWTVGIYVDGVHEADFAGKMNLGTTFLIFGEGMVFEDVLSEDEEEPPLEPLPSDFMTITPNDFGIADGENSPFGFGIKKLAFNGDASLDRKILNMNVTVDGNNIQMFYGCKTVGDQENGLLFRFVANDSQITIIDKGGYGKAVGTLSGSVGNFDFSEKQYVNLKITTEFINADEGDTADDLRLGVFVNEVLYNNQYFVINDYKNSMDATLSLGIYDDENAKLVISTPKNYMPDTFRHLTFIDVGYGLEELGYDQAGASSTEIDWDKLLFSGKIKLNSVGSEIRFGPEKGWIGYRLEMTDSGLTLIWDDETNRTNVFTYPTIKEGTLFTLTLATEYVDIDGDGQKDDLKFGFWINGKMHANRWFYHQDYQLNGAKETSLTFCMDHKKNNSSCMLLSWKPNTNVENLNSGKQIFNIAEGGYLLASNGKIVVNDEEEATGTVLNTAGDYKVSIEEGNSTKNSTVILWEAGETHLDGKQTVQDLVAIIKAANGSEVSTEAAKKGADVTGDGKIDTLDVSLMREALVGAKALENKDSSNVSYLAGENVMPIGGFWGPTTDTLTDDVFKNIKDSGINLITWSIDTYGVDGETANVTKQLELADKYGISLFIRDKDLTNDMSDAQIAYNVADYNKYNSFRGLTIMDEPSNDIYGTSDAKLSDYNKISTKLNSYLNLNAYVNLLPLDEKQGTESVYINYVDEYCKTYNPKFLSYDDYPFNNNTVKNCSNYFRNLSIIRNKAAEYEIPFWSFVQVGAWGSKKTITEAQMKWNLNMNLAFGAKGIQYFPVVEPTGDAQFDGKGMFTEAGATTEYYGYVQKLNQWVATVDDILMNSESKGIITTGYYANKNIKDNGVATVDNYGKITSVQTNETGIAYGAVVGCFDYNGKTVAYVVNYDASKSHTITLKYSESTSYRLLKSDGESDMTGDSCAISLGAGEAALVVID